MTNHKLLALLLTGAALTLAPACSQPAPEAKEAPAPAAETSAPAEEAAAPADAAPAPAAEEAHDDEHAHDDDHAHEEEHDHDHTHEAPRGGTLVELGDHVAHVEFLHDEAAGRLSAYFLDAHCENPVRLPDASIAISIDVRDGNGPIALNLTPRANDLTGETVGDTSEFTLEDARIKGISAFDITLPKLTARGATFENISFPFPEGKQ